MIEKDRWLSNYFEKEGGAYRYLKPFDEIKLPQGFCYAKVESDDLESVQKLVPQGFVLVETSMLFVQKRALSETFIDEKNSEFRIRVAAPGDSSQVLNLAADAFTNARFFKDPRISGETARQIKHDWVGNFFKGHRGDQLFVCEHIPSGNVAGFLLLIGSVIDLIATSPQFLRRGVAHNLIAHANLSTGLLKAGTQGNNEASIRMYTRCHFELAKMSFTLHRMT